jgi:alginate O-acetyltransferase complex protein AlgJ
LPAILDFRDQLAKAHIDLVLLPVPAKAAVVPAELPDVRGPFPGRLDAADAAFYTLLRERGLSVIDLEPELAAPKSGRPSFCKTDSHWSGAGIALTAARLAERVKKLPWYASVPKRRFAVEEQEVEITGDLVKMLGDTSGSKEKLALRFVGAEGAPREPVPPDRASPLLVIGDSHTLVFHEGGDMHARGAGLSDQLTYELGFAVDLVGVRGSGATPARINLSRRKDGLAGKKLVIWVFGARELTAAAQGWAKVPVIR